MILLVTHRTYFKDPNQNVVAFPTDYTQYIPPKK